MRKLLIIFSVCFCLASVIAQAQPSVALRKKYFLIAHRGGIINNINTENSRPAIEAAIRKGYYMVEVDLRLTQDSVLIIQHDPTFKRYYGVDKPVSSMTWEAISKLRSSRGGSKVLSFENVLRICKGRIQLMIDNKIRGMDTVLFTRLITLLRKYGLLDHALMIGTAASTPFFTGKIKLSCTRDQLENNMKKPNYSPSDYYLFGTPEDISRSDIEWARKNNIQVVAVINRFRYYGKKDPVHMAEDDIHSMINKGVTYFQIDSEFDAPFF